MVKDIVCGMQVEESRVSAKSDFQEREYSFCSLVCKEKFDSDPQKYVEREKRR